MLFTIQKWPHVHCIFTHNNTDTPSLIQRKWKKNNYANKKQKVGDIPTTVNNEAMKK